jgi:cell wall-associated NlpC family hydrolase
VITSPGFLRAALVVVVSGAVLLIGGLALVPMTIAGGGALMFAAGAGNGCPGGAGGQGASQSPSPGQGPASQSASSSQPASPGQSATASQTASATQGVTPGQGATPSEGAGASQGATTSQGAGASQGPGPGSSPAAGGTGAGERRPGHRRAGHPAGAAATPGTPNAGAGAIGAAAGALGAVAASRIVQPGTSEAGRGAIPASYLALYREMGRRYGVPWVVLAGIGRVESDNGQSSLPGVRSGQNGFGAAGPMQIGIGGASGNNWGGAPVHPAGEQVSGVATDGNGDGVASVYEPADAIAGAAKYLLEHGVLSNVSGAVFAYNHLTSYVQAVLFWAGTYATGGFVTTGAAAPSECLTTTSIATGGVAADRTVAAAIAYARGELGKPYQWGATGPDAFDCSGLTMMAYRSAGVSIPRTSQQQWVWGPRVPAGREQPGDLVFFAGSDGTRASPGHVGMVIGHGLMIEAFATGFPIRIAPYTGRGAVGFTRPWAHAGVSLSSAGAG